MVKKCVRGEETKTLTVFRNYELHFITHHQEWCFCYLVNIRFFIFFLFFFSSNSRNSCTSFCWSWNGFIIGLLSFFSWTVSVLTRSLCFCCFSWILQSLFQRHLYLFHLSFWWESCISAFHLSCVPLWKMCCIPAPHSFRWAVIYHLSHPDRQVATFTKVRTRGEIRAHLLVYREMWEACGCAAFWISMQQADTAKRQGKGREV